MKKVMILVILAVAGYSVYQHYYGSGSQDYVSDGPGSISDKSSPSFPKECDDKCDALENAINDHEMGKITAVKLNQYTLSFRSCLRDAGFTDSQINETYKRIEKSTMSTEPGN